jgi:hypothetical protein
MDLDAIIERNGWFIVFETKSNGKPIPKGQEILLESLVGIGRFFVIILRCKRPEDITGWEEWTKDGSKCSKSPKVGDSSDLTERVGEWFRWANEQQQ